MTLSRFIKELQKIEAEGHGRAKVTCDKPSLWDGNGAFQTCNIHSVEQGWIRQVDGDGFGIENRDGSERTVNCVVIYGQFKD